jgi:hypothetical protein
MKEQENDVARVAQLVQEYWNRGQDSTWYHAALKRLADEIGEERVEIARDDYEEGRAQQCEAREDAWIESHYR